MGGAHIFVFSLLLYKIELFIPKGYIAKAQVLSDSSCPAIRVESNFNLDRYSGVWHEIESYPSLVDEFDICVSLNYTRIDDGLQVVSKWFNTSSRKFENITGNVRLIDPKIGAKLQVDYSNNSGVILTEEGNHWVLETDYLNYAIIYLCVPRGPNDSAHFLTYLSRDRFPFRSGVDFVHSRIRSLGLDTELLKPHDQINCSSL